MAKQKKKAPGKAAAPEPEADYSLRYPAGKWLQVMNWRKVQCYKSENAPWMKVCSDIFVHPNYVEVDDHAKVLIMAMFNLALKKTMDGLLPGDPELLQEWLGMDHPPDLEPLLVIHGDAQNPFLRYLTKEQYRAERDRIAALIDSKSKGKDGAGKGKKSGGDRRKKNDTPRGEAEAETEKSSSKGSQGSPSEEKKSSKELKAEQAKGQQSKANPEQGTGRAQGDSPAQEQEPGNPKESQAGAVTHPEGLAGSQAGDRPQLAQGSPQGTPAQRGGKGTHSRPHNAEVSTVGDCMDESHMHWKHPPSVAYGCGIYNILFKPSFIHPENVATSGDEVTSEVGNWAKAFFLHEQVRSDDAIKWVEAKARHIARYTKVKAKRGPYLRSLFNKHFHLAARSPPE
jgi:hypothetical protein